MSDASDGTVKIGGRLYPSKYPPGTNWATDEAWTILDTYEDVKTQLGMPPLDIGTRAYLAGAIAVALTKQKKSTLS